MGKLEEIEEGAEGFALGVISTGIFIIINMYEPFSKVIGAVLATGGVYSLHLAGYSPINLGKEVIGTIGALARSPFKT